jgi:DNA-binding CsgD family transcriptional regulator
MEHDQAIVESRLIQRIYSAAYDNAQWGAVVADLLQILGAEQVQFELRNAAGITLWRQLEQPDSLLTSDTLLLDLLAGWLDEEAAPSRLARGLDENMPPATEPDRTADTDTDTLRSCIKNHNNDTLTYELLRNSQHQFTAGEIALFSRITPHLLQAANIASSLHHERIRSACIEQTLNVHVLHGVMLLTDDLRVIYLNPRGKQIIGENRAALSIEQLPSNQEYLRLNDAREHLRLVPILQKCLSLDHTELVQIGNTKQAHLQLCLSSYKVPTTISYGGKRLVIAHINDLQNSPIPSPQVLRALFGISAREAEMCIHLLHGHNLAEATRKLGVSRETGRWYIKRIMEKTGTNRQAEMLMLMMRCGLMPYD